AFLVVDHFRVHRTGPREGRQRLRRLDDHSCREQRQELTAIQAVCHRETLTPSHPKASMPAKVRPFTPARQTAMTQMLFAALVAASLSTLAVSALKRVAFVSTLDYQLTIQKQPSSAVAAWWPSFVHENTLEGYCWNV